MGTGKATADGPAAIRELFSRISASFGSGDTASLSTLLEEAVDPGVVLHEPDSLPWGGVHRGIEGLKAVVGRVAQAIDLSACEIEEVVGREDYAVVLFRARVRGHAGEDPFQYFSEHYRFAGGRIVEIRVFWFDPSLASVANGQVRSGGRDA